MAGVVVYYRVLRRLANTTPAPPSSTRNPAVIASAVTAAPVYANGGLAGAVGGVTGGTTTGGTMTGGTSCSVVTGGTSTGGPTGGFQVAEATLTSLVVSVTG